MVNADACYAVFQRSVDDYHRTDDINAAIQNPFAPDSLEHMLYAKNWIDTVQWHMEDLIRNPEIDPAAGMELKRRIDSSNQRRTDMVERIDDYFVREFAHVTPAPGARINSETPAWLLDRMSILVLKIYHMDEQVRRTDVDEKHRQQCAAKLSILMEQKEDMRLAFDELVEDIANGVRRFKVYRQMKMYNDASLNPVLYWKGSTR